jgi:hypothetical protein
MAVSGARLQARSLERLHRIAQGQAVILAVVAVAVIATIAVQAAAAYFLLVSDIPAYRAWAIIGAAFSSLLDVFFLLLVWVLFDEIHRGQREAERLQSFMDSVYRRSL